MHLRTILYTIAICCTMYLAAVAIRVFDRSRSTLGHLSWLLQGTGTILTALLFFVLQLIAILVALLLVWGLAYWPLRYGATHLGTGANAVLLFILFLYFFLMMMLTGSKRLYTWFDPGDEPTGTLRTIASSYLRDGLGFLIPLSIITGTVMVGVSCFAALTAHFVRSGDIALTSALGTVPFHVLSDQYLWHFLDLVPQLKVNETIGWNAPATLSGTGAGWLLLAFKCLMIYVVIARFYTWAKWRRGELKEKTAATPHSIA